VVLALNKLLDLGDMGGQEQEAAASAGAKPRRFSAVTALGEMLTRSSSKQPPPCRVAPFLMSDLDTLSVLSRASANLVRTAELYDRETRHTRRLGALLALLADARTALEHGDPRSMVHSVSHRGRDIFECDRCTFFTVDKFAQELVGHFLAAEDREEAAGEPRAAPPGGALRELRVPLEGIVGHVVATGQPLNVADAWSDGRFSRDTDLRTGYRTRTVLCAPLVASSGRVVGVLQCINKCRGEVFGRDDEEMLSTVSMTLSDLIQRALLQNSYDSFIRSNDAINDEVKDMFHSLIVGSQDSRAVEAAPAPRGGLLGRARAAEGEAFWEGLRSWELDVRELVEDSGRGYQCVFQSLRKLGVLERCAVDGAALERFCRAMKATYLPSVPYHSWEHALRTWHATFLLLDGPTASDLLPAEDVLALLLAALGHDADHPGNSNGFQVATESILALRYNDASVLESHHAAVTCGLLAGGSPPLLARLEQPARQRVRQVIVASILHTDMAKHQESVAWLEAGNADLPGLRAARRRLEGEAGIKLGSALLHCADLVHPALPWATHRRLSCLIAQEFFAQYQEEQRRGLPSLPFMGKDPNLVRELAPIQVGFIQFVAMPLWSGLNFAAGNDCLSEVYGNICANRARWERLAEGEEVPDRQPFQQPRAA